MKVLGGNPPTRKGTRKRKLLIALLLVLVSITGFLLLPHRSSDPETPVPPPRLAAEPAHTEPWAARSELLARRIHDLAGAPHCFHIPLDQDRAVTLRSSPDTQYQSWVERRLGQSMALAAAAVVMKPSSGRLIAMSVFNEDPDHPLAFFWKTYPAASIFKVVTAAAALDRGLLAPDSVLEYTGRPHTLYRRQLEQKESPWSHQVSLAESFARSINPVFGKIGIHTLGQNVLAEYGSAFFFNQPFPCELPVQTSTLRVPGEAQKIAEVASGFNRNTLISPVQAAWIASVIAADGSAPPPWFVESIQSDPFSQAPPLNDQRRPIRALPLPSARQMQELMEATIRYGTCRQSFSDRKRYAYMRHLTFGGKTGNINDRQSPVKYDWFVGYALGEDPEDALALSVLMFHGEKLGHRANVMAFDLMRAYYRQKHQAETKRRGSS